jgi:hypothetical protein
MFTIRYLGGKEVRPSAGYRLASLGLDLPRSSPPAAPNKRLRSRCLRHVAPVRTSRRHSKNSRGGPELIVPFHRTERAARFLAGPGVARVLTTAHSGCPYPRGTRIIRRIRSGRYPDGPVSVCRLDAHVSRHNKNGSGRLNTPVLPVKDCVRMGPSHLHLIRKLPSPDE